MRCLTVGRGLAVRSSVPGPGPQSLHTRLAALQEFALRSRQLSPLRALRARPRRAESELSPLQRAGTTQCLQAPTTPTAQFASVRTGVFMIATPALGPLRRMHAGPCSDCTRPCPVPTGCRTDRLNTKEPFGIRCTRPHTPSSKASDLPTRGRVADRVPLIRPRPTPRITQPNPADLRLWACPQPRTSQSNAPASTHLLHTHARRHGVLPPLRSRCHRCSRRHRLKTWRTPCCSRTRWLARRRR